ncbi:MAG: heparan-alpha-glucosaminide N-acetyltransferase domain-containing protein [Planctomycetaceae bacterium]
MAAANPSTRRLPSLDQFRGYTVVGMMLVNYLGGFAACPRILKHTHDYCSYADTIMPQFLFAVGFAMRLTFGRRAESGGRAGYGRIVRRLLGLVLVSLVVYTVGSRAGSWKELCDMGFLAVIGEPLKRNWFQTLMHIAVTSLWILPVVRATAATRIAWLVLSAAAHVALSWWFNFAWVNAPPAGIDGGPLGFLTWCVPALVGTLACDAFVPSTHGASTRGASTHAPAPPIPLGRIAAAAALLMALGYVFSCGTRSYDLPAERVPGAAKMADDPVVPGAERLGWKREAGGGIGAWLTEAPFVPPPPAPRRQWNYWMMSQRAGSLSYLVFSAGFSLAVFLAFHLACDRAGWHLPLFTTFGTNAILAYVLHDMVGTAVQGFVPRDAPGWYVTGSLILFGWITWLFIRHFEKDGVYLRV